MASTNQEEQHSGAELSNSWAHEIRTGLRLWFGEEEVQKDEGLISR